MKPSRSLNLSAALALLSLLLGCSLQAPELVVTGERTALERQVLGSYQQLNENLWLLASTRQQEDSLQLGAEQGSLLEAVRRRRFNRDDLISLLASGWLGEGLEGQLVLRMGRGGIDPHLELVRERVLRQENEDRGVLLDRLRRLNPGAEDEVSAVFRGILLDESPNGSWVQLDDGGWKRK